MEEGGRVDRDKEIVNRLRRIEGQIKGLQKMIEEKKQCSDVLIQVSAVRSAVNKVGTMIFETHFRECLEQALEDEGNFEEFINQFTTLMDRYVK